MTLTSELIISFLVGPFCAVFLATSLRDRDFKWSAIFLWLLITDAIKFGLELAKQI